MCSWGICNLILKQKFDSKIWKLLNNRRFSKGRTEQFARLDSNAGAHSHRSQGTCKYKQSVTLFSLYSKPNVEFGRKFSTSNTLQSFKQMTEHDKEIFKNYLVFGVIFCCVLFVIYMAYSMEYHQDYVYIEPPDDKK